MIRSRFGFVRYACPVAARMVVQKSHGIWYNNRALKVKEANSVKGKEDNQRPLKVPVRRREIGNTNRAPNMVQGGKSYAQALSGKRVANTTSITLTTFEERNGWLYESVIIRLKPLHYTTEFKEELKLKGVGDIQVRDGGGRDIVLTFDSVESMKEKLKSMEGWVYDWSESIKEWKKGDDH
ncbi:hypothetical protein ACSBR1_015502 [Camellia fascicularis]